MADSESQPVRVRTPGKYFVLALAAATIVVSAGVVFSRHAPSITASNKPSLETVKVGRAHYVPLPEFLVDLAPDRRGRVAYLKLSASIEVDHHESDELLAHIAAARPAIIERTTFFLRELQPEDFQGSAGMARVKRELLRRVNLVLGPVNADDVVINDLVIQ